MKISFEKSSATCVFCLLIISVISLFSLTEALTKPSGIKLVDNQYTGIVVAIHEDEQENISLIEAIKSMFVRASSYLYNATKKRAYFKAVTILIPSTWSDDPSYGTVRNESFRDADVIIAPPNPRFTPKEDLPPPPYTNHYGGCGKQGIHIHFTSRFLLDHSLEDIYGDFGRLLVHEWGHFRWGLFNEYPDSVEDDRFSDHFYLSSTTGLYEPVACPRSWNMSPMKYTGIHARPFKRCNGNNREGYESGCLAVTEEIQPHFTASIMMNKHLSFEQIIHFCDNDTEDQGTLHNSEANNKHNRLCGGRSSWEVMREHDDFNGDRNPPREIEDVRPTFKVIRENEVGKPIVLLLDTSGSMSTMNRSKRLQSVAKSFLISTVAHGCRVGIVDFDSSGKILSHLREMDSETSRLELAGLIVGDHTGGTCIGCGVMEALKIIPANETGKIILITDGRDSKIADLMAAQAECIRRGIVIDSIAYSDMAQAHLRVLSEGTGGKFYLQTDDPGSRGALRAYSDNSDCGRQKTSWGRIPVFSNVFTLAAGDSEETGSLEIDPTIGRETTFIFSYFVSGNAIQVELISPHGRRLDSSYTGYKQDMNSKIITVNILGIAEVGTWRFTITSRSVGSYYVTVSVSSLPTAEKVPPIKIRSYLSGTETEVCPQTPLVAIAEVRQGSYPIINARVIATVERPLSQSGVDMGPVEMILKDDGIGSDVTKNDGLYTRTFTNFTGIGFYGVSVWVESDGETLVLRPNTRPEDSKFDYDVMGLWNETFTFNAPFIETSDAKAPNFNRECSAGASYVSRIPDGWTPDSDIFPPSTIFDLTVTFVDVENAIVNISCTSPGGDMDSGKASSYVILCSNSTDQLKHDCSSDACAVEDDNVLWGNLSLPSEFGTREEFSIRVPMQEGQMVASFFFAVFAVDESGNRGKISNIVQAILRNDSFQAREESKPIHVPIITEHELIEVPRMTTGTKATTKPLKPTKVTQSISHGTMGDIQKTTDKDTINDKLTNQIDQMTKSEGGIKVETTAVVMMISSEESNLDKVTKYGKANVSEREITNTEAITESISLNTSTNIDDATRPDMQWESDSKKDIRSTIRPDTDWKTGVKTNIDASARPDTDWVTDVKTNSDSMMTPNTDWKTGGNTNTDATIRPDTDWKTDAKTNIDATIRPDRHWKTGSKTNIDATIRPDTDWKTDAKTSSDATNRPDTDGTTGAKTNIDARIRPDTDWKTGVMTNIDTTIRHDSDWKTGIKTNIDATSTPDIHWKTGSKTYVDAMIRPVTDWKTDAKTSIAATIRPYTDWKTGAKTDIDATMRPDTDGKTGAKTDIDATIRPDTDRKTGAKADNDATSRPDTDWKTGVKTDIAATIRPDTDWKTSVKTDSDATNRPDTDGKTGAKTDIDATIRPNTDEKTGAKTDIDATIRTDTDWKTGVMTNIDTTIRHDSNWKTGVKTNIDATSTPDIHWKTRSRTNIDAMIRPVTDWKTDAKTSIDATSRTDTDWKTGVKTNIDATSTPDIHWKTRSKTNIDAMIRPVTDWKTNAKTNINATSRPDTDWKTGVKTNIDATSTPEIQWNTGFKTNIDATIRPHTDWKTDAKTDIDATSRTDTDQKTGAKTDIDATIRPNTDWKTGVNTKIEATITPDTDWKTGAKTNIDVTIISDVERKTGFKTDIDATIRSDTDWKIDARTNIDASSRPDTGWKTGAKTNSDATIRHGTDRKTGVKTDIAATIRPDTDWKTGAKTNIEATIRPDTDWKTGVKTNIDATITTDTNWKTGAKTNIDATIISDVERKTGFKTDIDATIRPDTDWKTDAKTNIDASSRPDIDWKTSAKTNINTTTRPDKDRRTGAKTDFDTTTRPDTDRTTGAKTDVDVTIRPDIDWKTDVKTNIDATITRVSNWKTGVKTNIVDTIRHDTDWKTDAETKIDVTIRPDTNTKTGAKTNIDATITSDVERKTDVKTDVDATLRPDIEWKTGSNKNNESTIMLKTASKYDAIPNTNVSEQLGATMSPHVMKDGDTTTENNIMTTVDGTMHRTLHPEENMTETKNTIKIGCETKYGWKEFNRHCYKLLYLSDARGDNFGRGHNFTTMLDACKKEGPNTFGKDVTRVADITSKAENDFVANEVAKGKRAWIGAKRDGNGASFVWKIGDGNHHDPTLDGFTNWKPNEPNNKWNLELCVEINRGPAGGWNDIKCRRKLPILCKYSLSSLGK